VEDAVAIDERQIAHAAMLIASADSFPPQARQVRTRPAPSCPQPCAACAVLDAVSLPL